MAKISFTNKEFTDLKISAEELYEKIEEVWSPFLGVAVIFNVKGIDHLKMKRWNHARNRKDQYVRLKLLHLAPKVVKKSHTLQGIDEGNKFERIKVNSRWERRMMHVKYLDFISVIEGCRIRVVVKQVGDSQPYFWSIIPYWKQGDYGKKMFEGNPEED